MKKIILIVSMLISYAYAQKVYRLTSIPTYDSLGSQYGVYQEYDHIPTAEDSAKFEKDSRKSITEMILKNNELQNSYQSKNDKMVIRKNKIGRIKKSPSKKYS